MLPSSRKVVVLDRDGTVVVDREYLADPAGLEFLPGAAQGLRRLHQLGHRLVIISNQSGVGRGLFSLERLQQINARLRQMVQQAGAELAGIYCCPHAPEEDCACRKPKTGLLLQAARELGFDPHDTIVIGDKTSDVELGRRVGAMTILLAGDARAAAAHGAASVAPNLSAAVELIERSSADQADGNAGAASAGTSSSGARRTRSLV
jgi:D-glycero-D-manno-heptose 1,7-bisphosphate phosphatase